MKKERFRKVVEWNNPYCTQFDFIIFAFSVWLLGWITSFLWTPFYLFNKMINDWKDNRYIYWEKIK